MPFISACLFQHKIVVRHAFQGGCHSQQHYIQHGGQLYQNIKSRMMMWVAHIGHMVYMVIKPAGKNWPRDNEKKVQNSLMVT